PNATVVVSNLTPVEGEIVTVRNADNSDSTCEGGLAEVIMNGVAPPGILSQKFATPDAGGNWQVEFQIQYQADWPSNDVGGPFLVEAFCREAPNNNNEAGPAAEPEFAYVPVEVTLAQSDGEQATEPAV